MIGRIGRPFYNEHGDGPFDRDCNSLYVPHCLTCGEKLMTEGRFVLKSKDPDVYEERLSERWFCPNMFCEEFMRTACYAELEYVGARWQHILFDLMR